ncbi:MAG: nitroreductase family protein [Actinomycetota bacterium]|nr:nitroreductase family protein [Actinomycetota bacterium]MDA2971328.1 nitroreductase family protein [Actinomycetota bacterium]MDA3000194.1 nitroreductase family protein [Actinomycetota bacterium]
MSSPIDLFTGLGTTRSIRRYRSEAIPTEDLSAILWAAGRAPSGSNRQPFRFIVLTDGPRAQEAKTILGASFRSSWSQKRSHDGFDSGSGSRADSPKARQARAMQEYVDNFERVPAVVLVCLDRYREPNPYEGASVYPACQNLLLAARALGYGGVLTMWHLGVEGELRTLLSVPDHVALSACITLGRPAGSHGPVRRRPLEEIVFDDVWGRAAVWIDERSAVDRLSSAETRPS